MSVSNRATFEGPTRMYAKSVDVTARVAFGASGAPTLITAKSRGIIDVVRNSAGNFTFRFGSKINGRNVFDSAAWTENVEIQPDVSVTTNVAPAAIGVPAVYRDDITSGMSLSAPAAGNPSTSTSGGSLAATTAFFAKVTAVDAKGKETLASAEKTITTGAGATNSITWNWTAVPGAVSYRVYVGTATGAENVVFVVAGGSTASFVQQNTTSQASATADPPIQTRPPIAQAAVTVSLVNSAGAATDPASGEIIRFTFTFIDTSAG